MTRKRKHVRVRVRTSFNGLRRGDVSLAVLDARLQGWIDAGLVEVLDGETEAGPGSAQPDDDERVPPGTDGGVASSGEQGQGFGAGGYGASEEFDQG